jgi:HK97 family phage major capsid protein
MKIDMPVTLTAADSNKRTISGRIVTWGEQGNTSAGPTIFAAESIKFNKNVKLLLEHDRTRPIGKLLSYEVTSEGIDATFKIANTMAGEDALVEAADGLRDGFSVGVKVDAWDNQDGVMVISKSSIMETSLVTDPAIDSARVSQVAASEEEATQVSETTVSEVQPEGEQVSDTTVPETPAVAEAVEAHKVEAAATRPAFYTTPRINPNLTAGQLLEANIKASMGDEDARQLVLATNDTSTNTGLTLAPHLNEFITNTIDGRPAVDAVSRGSLPTTGMSFTIPKLGTAPTVDGSSTEGEALGGTEMASSYITVDVKKAAGLQTISWELLDRSGPSFYDELVRELNSAYAKATDQAMVAALTAGGTQATTQAATIAGFKAFVGKEVPAAYAAAGKFAKNIIANTAWWETIITAEDGANRPLFIASQPANSPGNVGVNSLTGQVMGLNLFVDPHMTTTTLIDDSAFIVVPESYTFYEAPKTQIQVQALANGRLQVAVYGYYAIGTKIGAGARRFNLT